MGQLLLTITVALVTAGCTVGAPTTEQAASPASARDPVPAPAAASFINKVWAVAESQQVALGDLRVFLSGGTLVMTSSHATPAFGTWSYDDGRLKITEEGLTYDVDILELTGDTFRIRIHNPGEPIVIRFTPAASPPASVSGDGAVGR
jgi:hypothetical protein